MSKTTEVHPAAVRAAERIRAVIQPWIPEDKNEPWDALDDVAGIIDAEYRPVVERLAGALETAWEQAEKSGQGVDDDRLRRALEGEEKGTLAVLPDGEWIKLHNVVHAVIAEARGSSRKVRVSVPIDRAALKGVE